MARNPTTPNEKLDALAGAQTLAGSGAVNSLLDQADSLLDRLVGKHRGGQLSDRDAAVGLAVISELRSAADKAQRAINHGYEAGASLTTTPESER